MSPSIGNNRMDAIYRIGGLAVLFIAVPTLLTIGVIAGLIWMGIDVTSRLLLNNGGLKTNRLTGDKFLKRLYEWPLDMAEWVVFGKGSFPWLP